MYIRRISNILLEIINIRDVVKIVIVIVLDKTII